jgi:hypothetical protein
MKLQVMKSAVMALTPVALLALAACSTPVPQQQGKVETYQQEAGGAGYGGQVVVDTITTNVSVVSIDVAQRKLVLRHPDGKVTTYKVGPEVTKFNQIKVGDEIKATVVEEFALSLDMAGTLPSVSASASAVAVPNGAEPGVKTVNILSYTAKVLAIDLVGHQATLQMADGQTKTMKVREAVNLADFSPGDTVSVRLTEATTILVENPPGPGAK